MERQPSKREQSDSVHSNLTITRRGNRINRLASRLTSAVSEGSEDTVIGCALSVKDSETHNLLASAFKNHFVFSRVPENEYPTLFSQLPTRRFKKDSDVFRQGERGDSCYFVRSGTLNVVVDGRAIKELKRGDTFGRSLGFTNIPCTLQMCRGCLPMPLYRKRTSFDGELALLYDINRSATITSTSDDTRVIRMDAKHFHRCMDTMKTTQEAQAEAFLKSDWNFKWLPNADLAELTKVCIVQEFNDGDIILREGEARHWLLIVMSGIVELVELEDTYQKQDTRKYIVNCAGSVIGGDALLYGKRQARSLRARGGVLCLALGRKAFMKLPLAVDDVLRRAAVKAMLRSMHRKLGSKDLFGILTEEQQNRLLCTMQDATFDACELILAPGDDAQLLVVVEGEVAILTDIWQLQEIGDRVFVAASSAGDIKDRAERVLTDGMGYGEQPELIEDHPMSRFLVALGQVRLHRITHKAVVHVFGEPLRNVVFRQEVKAVLLDILLFKNLRDEQIDDIVSCLSRRRYSAGEVIVKEGSPAKHFFLIEQGTVCVKKGKAVLRTLGAWDYFGERGLLNEEVRTATCQAMEECRCLRLGAADFFKVVGLFQKELERRMLLQDLNITLHDLKSLAVVGRGAFGVVRLVANKNDLDKQYALKSVRKQHVVKKRQQASIVMEREVNAQCFHPCIVQFIRTFQDAQNVYFLTEFLGGGDLFQAIRKIGNVTKAQSMFFTGSIVLAIEYLHSRRIMYRDLKPENVLFDYEGRLKLVDFGCCKRELSASTLIGTPEYMAPEVILGKGYTLSIDWWSLGVVIHEFIVGPLPFGAKCGDQMQLFKDILEAPLYVPEWLDDQTAVSIVCGLLERDINNRLGAVGAKEIKEHPYFRGFNWDALAGGFLPPPWTPPVEELKKEWEDSDSDLEATIHRGAIKDSGGMEWAKDF